MNEPRNEIQSPLPAPALNWAFLERTVRSTVVAATLVALSVAVYVAMDVGARYLFFALWSLAFFSTTGLIFKNLLFNRSRIKGFAAVIAKLALLVAVYAVLFAWPIQEHNARPHMIAMVAGVTTPLIVLVLRAMSWAMDQNKKERRAAGSAARDAQTRASDTRPDAEFQMQS